jgi:hypothetical protein
MIEGAAIVGIRLDNLLFNLELLHGCQPPSNFEVPGVRWLSAAA